MWRFRCLTHGTALTVDAAGRRFHGPLGSTSACVLAHGWSVAKLQALAAGARQRIGAVVGRDARPVAESIQEVS